MTPDAIRNELRRVAARRARRREQDTSDLDRIVELARQGRTTGVEMKQMAGDAGLSRNHLYELLR